MVTLDGVCLLGNIKGFGLSIFLHFFLQKNDDHLKSMQYAHPVTLIAASYYTCIQNALKGVGPTLQILVLHYNF
jgi:predicted membrane channel-forming protein YqfA (hemolysin III family)